MPRGAQGGPQGTTKAVVHGVFQDRLTDLRNKAKRNFTAFQGGDLRYWDLPKELLTDLFLIKLLHEPAHNRTPINTNYETVMKTGGPSSGTVGDAVSLDYQIDYNASEERALRARHASVCRSIAHAAGRRYGLAVGRTFEAIREQAEKMIQAGGG